MKRADINPTNKIKTITNVKIRKVLLFIESILLGKKFLNISFNHFYLVRHWLLGAYNFRHALPKFDQQ